MSAIAYYILASTSYCNVFHMSTFWCLPIMCRERGQILIIHYSWCRHSTEKHFHNPAASFHWMLRWHGTFPDIDIASGKKPDVMGGPNLLIS